MAWGGVLFLTSLSNSSENLLKWPDHLTPSLCKIITKCLYMATEILVNIGPGNSLMLIRQQPITWTKVDVFNSSWPSDVIWQQRPLLTLVQVIAWCRLDNKLYLNQGGLIQVEPSNLSEIRINIKTFSLRKFHLEMPSGTCGSFVHA